MVEPNIKNFYKSLNEELMVIKDRVRNLIGDANWGEEGRYKEAILKNVISKFIPKNYSIGTGFVMNRKMELTTQIDLIIYDGSSPVLFSDGDFVVVSANTVKAIIEVKTSIRGKSDLRKIIKKCEENAKKIELDFARIHPFFNGIFCYECPLSIKHLELALRDCHEISDCTLYRKVSNIVLGDKKYAYFWRYKPFSLRFYELEKLGFAYFISNLLATLDLHNYSKEPLLYPLKSKDEFEKFRIDYPEEKFNRYF